MTARKTACLITGVAVLGLLATPAAASGARAGARLSSLNEVPAVISASHGAFEGEISEDGTQIDYKLSYETEGEVAQAHIHVGQTGVNGGISVFLCSNQDAAPDGVQACPASPGMVSGSILMEDVIGPEGQGIGAMEMEKLIRAMARGVAYVNVHSDLFPGGEVRGQIHLRRSRGDIMKEMKRRRHDGDSDSDSDGDTDGDSDTGSIDKVDPVVDSQRGLRGGHLPRP